MIVRAQILAALFLVASLAVAQIPQPDGGPVEPGTLPLTWQTGGPNCMELPDWQIHEYNQDFYILRESGCTYYEKPFLYLIFGKTRALLVDTGAGPAQTRSIVDLVIKRWLERNSRDSIPLVVAHSHAHGDHVAGDPQFRNVAGVTLVEPGVKSVQAAFGVRNWPQDIGSVDLGGRILDVVPLPGHQEAAVAFYDRKTGVVLSGDTFYPGRLYVADWVAYQASIQRLVDFTHGKVVTHFLGCHIEQARQPYREYPIGSIYQPDEHSLSLERGQLLELNEALKEIGDVPLRRAYPDFTIFPMNEEIGREMERIQKETTARQKSMQWSQPH
jgi:hydroxyacylglutathione hydrolase